MRDDSTLDALQRQLEANRRRDRVARRRIDQLSAEASRLRDAIHREELRALIGHEGAVKIVDCDRKEIEGVAGTLTAVARTRGTVIVNGKNWTANCHLIVPIENTDVVRMIRL